MKKRPNQCLAIFMLLAVMLNGMAGSAYGLDSGTYVVVNKTYYVNPDTGSADDGGDTSTGEGMCRNTTYSDCLYELQDGRHYVTLRIKLISYIKNVRFAVQGVKGDHNSYKNAAYAVVGENQKENTRDFRIEIPAEDVLIKPTFFVGPMNRDVTYFIGLDINTAKQHDGSFTAFNNQDGSQERSESNPLSTDVTAGAAAGDSANKVDDASDPAVKAREDGKAGKKLELEAGDTGQAVTGTSEQMNSGQESTPAADKFGTTNKDKKTLGLIVVIFCAIVVTGACWLYRKKSRP